MGHAPGVWGWALPAFGGLLRDLIAGTKWPKINRAVRRFDSAKQIKKLKIEQTIFE